mmetsp:Transcript_8958/g.36562  ORF Transcript_8958/g.36562 Transcript_8958/m.36562 type:complete len:366 (+) Transcript_8958:3122-4219(+)
MRWHHSPFSPMLRRRWPRMDWLSRGRHAARGHVAAAASSARSWLARTPSPQAPMKRIRPPPGTHSSCCSTARLWHVWAVRTAQSLTRRESCCSCWETSWACPPDMRSRDGNAPTSGSPLAKFNYCAACHRARCLSSGAFVWGLARPRLAVLRPPPRRVRGSTAPLLPRRETRIPALSPGAGVPWLRRRGRCARRSVRACPLRTQSPRSDAALEALRLPCAASLSEATVPRWAASAVVRAAALPAVAPAERCASIGHWLRQQFRHSQNPGASNRPGGHLRHSHRGPRRSLNPPARRLSLCFRLLCLRRYSRHAHQRAHRHRAHHRACHPRRNFCLSSRPPAAPQAGAVQRPPARGQWSRRTCFHLA